MVELLTQNEMRTTLLNKVKKENEDLNREKKDLINENNKKSEQILNLNKILLEKSQESSFNEKKQSEVADQISKLEKTIENLNYQIEDNDKLINHQYSIIQSLKNDSVEMNNNLSQLTFEKDHITILQKQYEVEAVRLNKLREQSLMELVDLKSENNSLQYKVVSLEGEKQNILNQLQMIVNQKHDQDINIQKLNDRIFNLNQELDLSKDILDQQQRQIADYHLDSLDSKEEIESLVDDLIQDSKKIISMGNFDSRNEKLFLDKFDGIFKKIELLEKKMNICSFTVDEIITEKRKTQVDLTRLISQISPIRFKISQIEASDSSFAKKSTQINHFLNVVRERIHQLKLIEDRLSLNPDNLQQEIDLFKHQNEQYKLEIEVLNNEKSKFEEVLKDHHQMIEDLSISSNVLSQKVKELELELESSQASFEALKEKEIENINNHWLKRLSEMQTHHSDDLEKKEVYISDLKNQIKSRENQLQTYAQFLTSEKMQLLNSMQEFAEEISLSSELNPMKDYLKATEYQLSKMELQLKKTPMMSPDRVGLEASFNQLVEQRDFLNTIISTSQQKIQQKANSILNRVRNGKLGPVPPLPPSI